MTKNNHGFEITLYKLVNTKHTLPIVMNVKSIEKKKNLKLKSKQE